MGLLHISTNIFSANNVKISQEQNLCTYNEHFDFFDGIASTGRFKNASEVIRAGLRLLEEEECKIVALKKAIQEGVDSGLAKNFNAKKHLERLKAAKQKNG